MDSDQYDVVIVGAGPAGATAAILLAKKGRRVALVDRATFPRPVTCSGWLNARAIPLLKELSASLTTGRSAAVPAARAFRDVTFYRADFTQTAKPTFDSPPGYLIDRAAFDHSLVRTAVDEGVTLFSASLAVDFKLLESQVVVELEGVGKPPRGRQEERRRSLEGRLLFLATGRETRRPAASRSQSGLEMLERVGVAPAPEDAPRWLAQVEAPLDPKTAPKSPRVGVVLGLDQGASFAMCCVSKDRMSVGVDWLGDRADVIPNLVQVCRHAFERGVIPVDVAGAAHSAEVIQGMAATALDMDSHVGKHALVIGEAGGFVSVASHEGIYPAMWSARIAVEVADKALQSVHSQDELMTFDSVWRMEMADYLRTPHTDIQFLLPLIFTNQPMADRMGAAFFLGENI